jgi:hypothetical protein
LEYLQVKEVTIRGVASDVDVQLKSIDGVLFVPEGSPTPSSIVSSSSAAVPGATRVVDGRGVGVHQSPRGGAPLPAQLLSRPSSSVPTSGSGTNPPLPSPGRALTGPTLLSRKLRASAAHEQLAEAMADPDTFYTSEILGSPLWFGEVVPGSTFTRRIIVANTTALPFPFK